MLPLKHPPVETENLYSLFLKSSFMEKWSENKQFWAETIRTIILTSLGVLGVYFIVDPLKNKTAYDAELSKERLSIKSSLVDNFLTKSHKYAAVAYDALKGDSASIELYKNEVGDDYNNSVNRLIFYFSQVKNLQEEVLSMRHTDSLLHDCFTRKANKNEWEPIRKKLKEQHLNAAKAALLSLGL